MNGATLLGLGAIVLWGLLAVLSAAAGKVPPFQMNAMTFTVGAFVGLAYVRARGIRLAFSTVPRGAWALGVYGLFGFHAAYFFAVQNAPVMDVTLINYLWPLMIVLFSAFVPERLGGTPLRWWHVAGAMMSFAGVVTIVAGGASRPNFASQTAGLAAAVLSALIWSSYSVASRAYRGVSAAAVAGFCAATALLSAMAHLAFEQTIWPSGTSAWVALLVAGLGPVGLAFYLWDEGMKHGDMRLLGVASYATPLISTTTLAASGYGQMSGNIWLAALLIVGGALLAGAEQFKRRRPLDLGGHD